jgi:hypothetical protein
MIFIVVALPSGMCEVVFTCASYEVLNNAFIGSFQEI